MLSNQLFIHIFFLQSVENPASLQAEKINHLFNTFNVAAAAMLLLVCVLVTYISAHLFYTKACEYCHAINNYGGKTGPDLTYVGNRLSQQEITIRIVNGANNMPAFGGTLTKDELNELTAFLASQK